MKRDGVGGRIDQAVRRFGVNRFQALFILVLVIGWFTFWQISYALAPPPEPEKIQPLRVPYVGVTPITAQEFRPSVELRATTEASFSMNLNSKIRATVIEIPVRQGQRVRKGQLVCRLQSHAADAALRQSRTDLQRATLEFEGTRKLYEKGMASPLALRQVTNALEMAKAGMARALETIEYTRITAPTGGVVDRIYVDPGDIIRPDGVCAGFIVPDKMLLIGHVAERDVGMISQGADVDVVIDSLTGERIPGRVTFVARSGNEQSRSYRIEAEIANPDGRIRNGMTARLHVYADPLPAYYIKSSALTLGSDDSVLTFSTEGRLGIRMVDPDADPDPAHGRVRFVPVRVLNSDRGGIWLAGPRDGLLISVGTDFVADGERVRYGSVSEPELSTPAGRARP